MRLAKAIATTLSGFARIRPPSQSSPGSVRLRVEITPIAPRESSLRIYRFPIFEILPSRSLPPLECGFGGAGRNAIRPRDGPHTKPGRQVAGRAEGRYIGKRCSQNAGSDRPEAKGRPAIKAVEAAHSASANVTGKLGDLEVCWQDANRLIANWSKTSVNPTGRLRQSHMGESR